MSKNNLIDIYVVYETSYFEDRGYRSDLYIKKKEKWYQINVFDIETLNNEATGCFNKKLGYNIVPNLMIVEKITNEEIIKNANTLNDSDYFEQILPCQILNEEIVPILKVNSVTKEKYHNIPINSLIKVN